MMTLALVLFKAYSQELSQLYHTPILSGFTIVGDDSILVLSGSAKIVGLNPATISESIHFLSVQSAGLGAVVTAVNHSKLESPVAFLSALLIATVNSLFATVLVAIDGIQPKRGNASALLTKCSTILSNLWRHPSAPHRFIFFA